MFPARKNPAPGAVFASLVLLSGLGSYQTGNAATQVGPFADCGPP